jgi:hypothetical protein
MSAGRYSRRTGAIDDGGLLASPRKVSATTETDAVLAVASILGRR